MSRLASSALTRAKGSCSLASISLPSRTGPWRLGCIVTFFGERDGEPQQRGVQPEQRQRVGEAEEVVVEQARGQRRGQAAQQRQRQTLRARRAEQRLAPQPADEQPRESGEEHLDVGAGAEPDAKPRILAN